MKGILHHLDEYAFLHKDLLNGVSPYLDRVNASHTVLQTQLLKHDIPSRLQQLPNDSIRLREIALQQQHTSAIL